MPSPPVDEASIASTSTSTQESAAPSSSTARSLLSFWGNGAGPSQPSAARAAVPKRKRKKADNGISQARIGVRDGDGTSWNMQKAEVAPVVAGKGKSRNNEGGEEDELKEMSKRAKQTAKPSRQKRGRKKGGAEDVDDPGGDTAMPSPTKDSSFIGAGTAPAGDGEASRSTSGPALTPSPAKRKRATRPRKSAASTTTTRQATPEIVTVPSSDPPMPTSPDVKVTGANILLKSSHPFFSRTNSTSSRGAVDDPIDIDETTKKTGPKKLIFAADTKPAHPLFARPATANGPSETRIAALQPGLGAAIPSDPGVGIKSTKVHAFFNGSGVGAVPGKVKNGWGQGFKEGEEPAALLPGGLFPLHVPSNPPPGHVIGRLARRTKVPPTPDVDTSLFWSSVLEQAKRNENGRTQRHSSATATDDTPHCTTDHPALSSVKRRRMDANREAWAERYRPTAAKQVLGNEVEATYLRDWLRVLSVGTFDGTARKVARKVKKGKAQLVEGWIVDDAGIFGDAVDGLDDEEDLEYVDYEEPDLALGQRPNSYPDLATGQLTNTMLLAGATGTGKSAAVHAAATELGWEIFEVYPGMGKRTGGNLMSWVGDVGKNHLVVKGNKAESVKPNKNNIGAFFAGAKKRTRDDDDPIAISGSQGSMKDPIEIEESPREEKEMELDVAETSTNVRQSLILIDEADILFAEENTFWPAVISLIAESRRPVIITCNDMAHIPLSSLPLQAILHFHTPPPSLAISFLEAVAQQEGNLHSGIGAELYRDCLRQANPALNQPLPPNGNEPLPAFDLRQALSQMQLDRSSEHASKAPVPPQEDSIFASVETASWMDAFVSPRSRSIMDVHEIDRYEASLDDVIGLHALFKPDIHDLYQAIPAYDYSSSMSEALLDLAGGMLPALSDLQTEQVYYVRSLLPLLDPIIPLGAPLLPAPTLFTLYMPTLQGMVECEDLLEVAEAEAVSRGEGRMNRRTGRPKRTTVGGGTGYGRYLDLPQEALDGARNSRLLWTDQ